MDLIHCKRTDSVCKESPTVMEVHLTTALQWCFVIFFSVIFIILKTYPLQPDLAPHGLHVEILNRSLQGEVRLRQHPLRCMVRSCGNNLIVFSSSLPLLLPVAPSTQSSSSCALLGMVDDRYLAEFTDLLKEADRAATERSEAAERRSSMHWA